MITFSVKNFDRFQHYKDRAPPWIKLYNELLDDYDFGRLTDASKFHLIAIWLLASRSENKLPFDPVWIARRINAVAKVNLDELAEAGFIVVDQTLQTVEQVASTPLAKCLSRERVEGEAEKKDIRTVANATRPSADVFENFWKAYPRREGANPKEPARKLFLQAVKGGTDPQDIINGARQCAKAESKNVGTPYIPQAVKWLRDRRWEDYRLQATGVRADADIGGVLVKTGTEAWDAWQAHLKATTGKGSMVSLREDGWRFDTEYPPGYERRKLEIESAPIPQLRAMQ